MIEVRDLVVRRRGACICAVPALSVRTGERVGIVGPNGSGKSTLLRVLGGLERTFEGRCDVSAERNTCVYVHQSPYLFRGTVLSNVVYGLSARRRRSDTARKPATAWLERLGVAGLVRRRVEGLSGGERRRVALARALILEPRLLLLDEPLADLDEQAIGLVSAILRDLRDTTILIASPTDLPTGLGGRTHRFESPDDGSEGP